MALRNRRLAGSSTAFHRFMAFTLDSQGASATVRVARFRVPHDIEILAVETDTLSGTAAPTLDVLNGATSVLTAPIALGNNAQVAGTLTATLATRVIRAGTLITINSTTAGGGAITRLTVVVTYRPTGLQGGQA